MFGCVGAGLVTSFLPSRTLVGRFDFSVFETLVSWRCLRVPQRNMTPSSLSSSLSSSEGVMKRVSGTFAGWALCDSSSGGGGLSSLRSITTRPRCAISGWLCSAPRLGTVTKFVTLGHRRNSRTSVNLRCSSEGQGRVKARGRVAER